MKLPSDRDCEQDRDCVFAIASRLLQYPDAELLGCLEDVERIVAGLPRRIRQPLLDLVAMLRTTPLLELQASYVETFDLRRRNSLYLTYARAGDTRGRGNALVRFAQLYRKRGYSIEGGELADFLPALLELAALANPDDREPFEMLVEHRAEIGLLRASLESDQSPYADVLKAVEYALPRPNQKVVEATRRLIEDGPPEEQVGVVPDFVWQGRGEECPAAGEFDPTLEDEAAEAELAMEARR